MSGSVLLVEDEPALRTSMSIALRRGSFDVEEAESAARAKEILDRRAVDLVLTDLRLLDGDGLEVLQHARARAPETGVVIITAFGTVETAVQAMRLGASDFVQKPFTPEQLLRTVRRAIDLRQLAVVRATRFEGSAPSRDALVAKSAPMRDIAMRIEQASQSRSVLILGETGTGKELVAHAIHEHRDPRSPFVVVNCAGLSEALLESELFGHVPGAFTGAIRARRGLLAQADGGTVFLDEIGEIEPTIQAKLLRFLQFGEVRPLGSNNTQHVRARIIAATNRDLVRLTQERRFREDLLYRLDVFRIEVPPLRARLDDLADLCEHILRNIASELQQPPRELGPGTLDRLALYSWPGNVRELENVLERAVLTAGSASIAPQHLSLPLVSSSEPHETLASVERRHILGVLDTVAGDRKRAVDLLGISRSTLRRKLMEYGLWTASGDPSDDE